MHIRTCPFGTTVESRTHTAVGECEKCKEERDVLGMRKFDEECDMEDFGRLE